MRCLAQWGHRLFWVFALVLVLLAAARPAGAADSGTGAKKPRALGEAPETGAPRSGRMACADIVRVADQWRARAPNRLVEVATLGRVLDQDLRWVERCLRLYGRRPLKPAPVHEESREEEEQRWEDSEPEEIGREETGEGHEAPHHPEKQRRIRRAPPTPVKAERE